MWSANHGRLSFFSVSSECTAANVSAADCDLAEIVVTAGAPSIPGSLQQQLADGGRLLVPVGSSDHQVLVRITREGDRFERTESTPCVFVPLIGSEGWMEDDPPSAEP